MIVILSLKRITFYKIRNTSHGQVKITLQTHLSTKKFKIEDHCIRSFLMGIDTYIIKNTFSLTMLIQSYLDYLHLAHGLCCIYGLRIAIWSYVKCLNCLCSIMPVSWIVLLHFLRITFYYIVLRIPIIFIYIQSCKNVHSIFQNYQNYDNRYKIVTSDHFLQFFCKFIKKFQYKNRNKIQRINISRKYEYKVHVNT